MIRVYLIPSPQHELDLAHNNLQNVYSTARTIKNHMVKQSRKCKKKKNNLDNFDFLKTLTTLFSFFFY